MKDPQIISVEGANADSALVVWGGYVIKDSNPAAQEVITTPTSISVDIDIFDVTGGTFLTTVAAATMNYDSDSKFWSIPLTSGTPTLGDQFTDLHKYVARVSEVSGGSADMREFHLEEFAVDNNSFEDVLMRMPYEVRELSGDMHIVWYDTDAHIGNLSYAKYKAPAYEGGTGSTHATDPSRVTHRGAIVSYSS